MEEESSTASSEERDGDEFIDNEKEKTRRARPRHGLFPGPPEQCLHNGCEAVFSGPSGGRPAHMGSRSLHLLNCIQPCKQCKLYDWKPLEPHEHKEHCPWCNRWLLVNNKNDRDAARKHIKITCWMRPADAPSGPVVPLRACPHTGCDWKFSADEARGMPRHVAADWQHILKYALQIFCRTSAIVEPNCVAALARATALSSFF